MKVRLKNVILQYSGEPELEIDEFEFDGVLGVIGSMGAGKTSFVNILAGLEEINTGEIFFSGIDIAGMKPSRRGIVLINKHTPLLKNKSVFDNLTYSLKKRGIKKEVYTARVLELASELGLTMLLKKKVKKLCTRARIDVLLARAFVRKANLILIDGIEEVAGQDIDYEDYFYAALKGLIEQFRVNHNDNEGTCIVITSERRDKIENLCKGFLYLDYSKHVRHEGRDAEC